MKKMNGNIVCSALLSEVIPTESKALPCLVDISKVLLFGTWMDVFIELTGRLVRLGSLRTLSCWVRCNSTNSFEYSTSKLIYMADGWNGKG